MKASLIAISAFFILVSAGAQAETMMDEGPWSGADVRVLEPGTQVITDDSLEAEGLYIPKGSVLRVVDVQTNQPGFRPGRHSFEELPLGFKATVTLGPRARNSSRRLISFKCEKFVGQAGAYSRAQVPRFDCTLGFRETLPSGTSVYDGH